MKEKKNQIIIDLLNGIYSGEYPLKSILPSESELCKKFNTSTHYVRSALSLLKANSLIASNKKGGTIIIRRPFENEINIQKNLASNRVILLNHCIADCGFQHIHVNNRLLTVLEKELNKNNFSLEIHEIGIESNLYSFARKVNSIVRSGVVALIIIHDWVNYSVELSEIYSQLHENIFVFDRGGVAYDNALLNTISINNCLDGVLAAEAALMSGAKRIIFLLPNFCKHHIPSWVSERQRGVHFGKKKMNVMYFFIENLILDENFQYELLTPKTVIIAGNDETAAEFIDSAKKYNLEPPRDYKIIGFDNDSRYKDYKLTTISPNLEVIAKELALGIKSSIQNNTFPGTISKKITSKLIKRETL